MPKKLRSISPEVRPLRQGDRETLSVVREAIAALQKIAPPPEASPALHKAVKRVRKLAPQMLEAIEECQSYRESYGGSILVHRAAGDVLRHDRKFRRLLAEWSSLVAIIDRESARLRSQRQHLKVLPDRRT